MSWMGRMGGGGRTIRWAYARTFDGPPREEEGRPHGADNALPAPEADVAQFVHHSQFRERVEALEKAGPEPVFPFLARGGRWHGVAVAVVVKGVRSKDIGAAAVGGVTPSATFF